MIVAASANIFGEDIWHQNSTLKLRQYQVAFSCDRTQLTRNLIPLNVTGFCGSRTKENLPYSKSDTIEILGIRHRKFKSNLVSEVLLSSGLLGTRLVGVLEYFLAILGF